MYQAIAIFQKDRRSPPEVFLYNGVLEICSKLAGEQPCWIVYSTGNLLPIFKTPFRKNTYGCAASDKIFSFPK